MNFIKQHIGTAWWILLALILWLVWYEAYHAYMINHTYYYTMLADGNNWSIVLWFVVLSLLPIWVLLWSKKQSLSTLSWSIVGTLLLSWFVHTTVKWGLVGSAGSFIFLFNMIVLLWISIIFFGGLYTIWHKIYTYLTKSQISNRSDILLSLWIGLWVFLLLNYILVVAQLFYPILAWIQFIILWWSIRYYKKDLINTKDVLHWLLVSFNNLNIQRKTIYALLLIITIIYMMFWFNLSYIPYSTARDANHAYMYYPKVWSLNNGVFFTNWPITFPYIWMTYIAYWFSLLKPFSAFTFWPDTLAVFMNSISWWLSLIFWLWALDKVIKFIGLWSKDPYHTSFWLWRMRFLLWLMSGMWAFLVFVDNKTDLWVMSLTMLALMSWFIFIEKVWDSYKEQVDKKHNYILYAILCGIFFALAIIAKPTAFQDLIIFWLLLVWLWIWLLWVIWWFLLILGILWRAETMSIVFYINKWLAAKVWITWLLSIIGQGIIIFRKKSLQRIKPISIRIWTVILLLVVFKWWYILTQQIISDTIDVKTMIKGILLGNDTPQNNHKKIALLADTGDGITINNISWSLQDIPSIKPNSCTLEAAGLDKQSLFENLSPIQGWGLIEDLWRYIGFWQRVFSPRSTWDTNERKSYGSVAIGYPLLKIFFHKPWCYSLNNVADTLCEDSTLLSNKVGLTQLLNQTDTSSNQYNFLSGIIAQYNNLETENDTNRKQSITKDIQKSLTDYIQGNVVEVKKDANNNISIAIPYAYLTPLNVIFNRSLQNLSSYYTDIGFIWILSLILLLAGLCYSLFMKNKKLMILHLVTILGWIIWRFIASGIIWYAVGIIAWTLFCNASFLSLLLSNDKNNIILQRSIKISIGIVVLTTLIQTIFNLFRIASQWWAGPFTWYKWATGKESVFVFSSQGLSQQEKVKYNYDEQDVFNMQFGHYNPFINHIKNRKDEDWVLIAWTYIQYFLNNQKNITNDGLLTTLRQRWSDENTCNLALRLQDKKVKYLIIDPNIWSVVMGWGNASLFDRFVAKIDSNTNKIIQHGTMSMLAKMIEDGYLKLIMTNNMWAKYAYTLTNKELEQAISVLPSEELKTKMLQSFYNEPLLFRSKLAVPRFFGNESQDFFVLIGAIFQQRLSQDIWLEDLANILGKDVEMKKLSETMKLLQVPWANLTKLNKQLTDDERTVIGYYTAISQRQKANDQQGLQSIMTDLLQSSLWWWSQLITFELQI